ncbi:glycosylhydrolase family 6-1 [Colletotrichum orchidophilum]|uniref:Glucanase n=1 Tax=Colletotrichum orchidophilum TaxID=1209926 RepID=A0A1G4AZU3_9PEZI|nr:glycosylhydrolase family 6-1 [Colletotrichum orchidophilum]OHE94688.1 glycosylhydrolase family 6-1 [Colletotrichum orchidophilum]
MNLTAATLVALASMTIAAPSQTIKEQPPQAAFACSANVSLDAKTNIFSKYTLHANSFYRAEIQAAAAAISDGSLKAKALKVADVGSFLWLDTIANIQRLTPAIADVPCDHILGLVIYNLPGRDCAANASNGELKVGELNRYKTEYIDPIVKILKTNPKTAFALVIEPDSLPNLVTNANLQTCQNSASGYRDGVAYAIKTLNLPNVVMYLDAGHGGWLGPGSEELAKAYKAGGSPSQLRGIATNIAGWNSCPVNSPTPRAPDGQYNKAQNEKKYVTLLGVALQAAGMPNHAIVDTGRNGVQGLRLEWGDWCNVNGAGFGLRPSGSTGLELADAFVWVKPGGESDGTSDSSATRYDSFCGKSDAYKPSPEAGSWNQAYFEMLLKNAKPSF